MGDPAVSREQADQRNKDKKLPRRSFLGWIWTFLAAIAAIEFIAVIFSFLSPRRDSDSIETEHPLVPAGRWNSSNQVRSRRSPRDGSTWFT